MKACIKMLELNEVPVSNHLTANTLAVFIEETGLYSQFLPF